MTDRTKVVLLGTGTPNSESERSGSCVAVIVDDRPYLFDAGPGLVRRAESACRSGIKGLELPRLNRVFLTHLHSDHTTGLPDLLLAPWVLGRSDPLEVIGPSGTSSMMEHIHEAFKEDIKVRTEGLEHANGTGHRVYVREIEEGPVYKDDRISVHAFRVKHTSFEHAFGYRIRTPDRVIAISGDCAPTKDLVDNYRDLDLLVHEVYSTRGFEGKDPGWKRYHSNAHTSSQELSEILNEVRPELTVLYHQLLWGVSPEDLLAEINGSYDGKVVFGKDLDVY